MPPQVIPPTSKATPETQSIACIHYGRESTWPANVGEAIYYASYATALVRRGERIGKLTDAELITGFKKIARWKWIGEDLLTICAKAQSILSEGRLR